MKQSETEITLEQYLHFYDHACGANLSRYHLNQIIYMHGFMKLHRLHKRNLMELLEAIELAPPRRSTLLGRRGASARAPLTAAEAAEDVAALGWEECPTPDSPADEELVARSSKLQRRRRGGRGGGGGGGGGEGSGGWAPPPADFVVRGRRPRSNRKRASINALTAASSATGPAGAGAGAGSSSPSTVSSATQPPPPPPLWTRTRSRSRSRSRTSLSPSPF